MSDPNQPLFPLPSNSSGSDSPTTGSADSAESVPYPWPDPVAPHSGADASGGTLPKRGIPQPWIIAPGVLIAVAVVIAAVLALAGRSDSGRSSSARTAEDSVPVESSRRGERATPQVSVLPPIMAVPDIYGENCSSGLHLNGQSGWGTSAGRGSPETSCFFAKSVLLAYAGQHGAESVERRTVIAQGSVPCPSTGARCAGNDFVVECAALGSEPWITCMGGRNARVFIY